MPRLTALALTGLSLGCQDPTQVRLHVRTDVAYDTGRMLSFAVAPPEDMELATPSAAVDQPWGASGDIGTMVVVPRDDRNAKVGIRVVMGVTKDPTECTIQQPDGCIIARRQLQFLEHERLEMPVGLHAICEGVPCDENSTCNALGQCVSSTIEPAQCVEPDAPGCMPSGDRLPDGVDAGPDASEDAGAVDAGLEASGEGGDAATLVEGLLAHYRCDDDPSNGLTDSSPAMLGGSCEAGRCPTLAPGIRGTACDFDGIDDAVVVPVDMAQAPFTITFWTQIDDTSRGRLVSKPVGSSLFTWSLLLLGMDGDDFVYVEANDGTFPVGHGRAFVCNPCRMTPSICTACSHTSSTWYFAHLGWDGTMIRLTFTDNPLGSFGSASSAAKGMVFDGSPASFGAVLRNGIYSEFFDGRLDEVRIYGRLLSDDEVKQVIVEDTTQ